MSNVFCYTLARFSLTSRSPCNVNTQPSLYNTTRPPYSHCAVLLIYTLIYSKVQTKTSTPLASWFGDSASTARPPPRVYSVAYARLLRQSYVPPKASRDILDLCEHLQGSWILQRAAHILPHPLAMWNRPLIPNNIR